MKILISGLDSGGIGGAENFVYQLSEVLKKEKVKSSFLVVSDSELASFLKGKASLIKAPIRMDIIGGFKGLLKFFFFLPFSLVWSFKTLYKFKDKKGDILLLSGISDKILLTPIGKILGLSVVWIEFGPLAPSFKRNFYIPKVLYRLVKGLPDKVVTCSKNTKTSLIVDARISEAKIRLIPCGIKILSERKVESLLKVRKDVRREIDIQGKLAIGMVSRLEEEKGQDTLIKAAKILKSKFNNLSFVIVGKGDEKPLKGLTEKLGLKKEILFLGFRKDLFEVLSAFDIFVFPTRWKLEGFGLAPLEAMMMRVPVIASNFGPVPEVVSDAALLVEPTPKKVAEGIEKLIKDKKFKRELVSRGVRRVKKFDIKTISTKYLELFISVKRINKI